nr:hypothetical protein [Tanacetum cinerariifolium]
NTNRTPSHTSPEAQPSSHTHISSPSLPIVTTISTAPIPTVTPSETTPLRQYTQRARIAQSFALPLVVDEPASPVRDVSQGEACPTKSGFIADQDRTTIAKSSTLPYDSATRVTSPAAIEGMEEFRWFLLLQQFPLLIDEEIAKIHAEEELQQMIAGLDRSNKTIAKHFEEYDQAASELTIGERIELISELVKYQDHHFKILKYQAQQRKSRTKKQKRDFYMAVIRNNLGWKVKDFKGMSFEEVEGRIVGNKMHKTFPLPEEHSTAREERCHYYKKREATAIKIALLSMTRRNCQSKMAVKLS